MLQKLSKCEVKAWFCWNLIILPQLRFYVKSNFVEFKQSKNVVFGNFRGSGFWFLVNLSKFQVPNLPKFNVQRLWNCCKWLFGPFEFAKMWFHAKSEWRKNDQISTKSSINFTFWKFLEHSAIRRIRVPFLQKWNVLKLLSKLK